MSAVFERIFNRVFGRAVPSYEVKHTVPATTKAKAKAKKSVRIQEELNEVILIENLIEAKRAEARLRKKAMKLRSVQMKPFVPPVGTVLQMLSPKKNLMMAAVVLPDHRLLEVQRGPLTGTHLHPRFIFNTPFEWQCWVNKF